MKVICKILFLTSLFIYSSISAQSYDLRGQVSGWITSQPENDLQVQAGIRYIPSVQFNYGISDDLQFDANVSLNMFGARNFQEGERYIGSDDFDLYRAWLRLSSEQYEIRFGLQKINFGSASILRPLMWFDQVDSRDPLRLTEGVYSILFRYYFMNNSNIWLWVLYGNDKLKGLDLFATTDDDPEFGGRIQIPLLTGEAAISYHHRKVNLFSRDEFKLFSYFLDIENPHSVKEQKIGIDGKFDWEIGFWMEASGSRLDADIPMFKYQKILNLGVDYTFDIGTGLYTTTEFLYLESSGKASETDIKNRLSAFSMNYSIGLIDNVTMMIYYNWENDDTYKFLRWQQTYDNWSFYLMGFWNPDRSLINTVSGQDLFMGKGIQVMAVYNY